MIVADDLFNALIKGRYVKPMAWKRRNLKNAYYSVTFECEKCMLAASHTFHIEVVDGIHYISELSVLLFVKIHKIGSPQKND